MKTLNEQYYSLRLMLESALPSPAVIVVGGATQADESANVACCLARAFADASYKTVIIDSNGGSIFSTEYGMKVPLTPELGMMPTSAMNGTIKNLSALAVTGKVLRISTSVKKMQQVIADLRNRFEVVIVNAGVIPEQPEALQFASAADGVVLSFRFGRKPQRADRDVTAMLERIGANLLGIVAVAAPEDRRPEPAFRPQPREEALEPAPAAPKFTPATLPPMPVMQVKTVTKEAV